MQVLTRILEERSIRERIKALQAECRTGQPLTQEQHLRYRQIDKEKEYCMKVAESRCRKLRMGQVPFSIKMNKLGGRIKLWGWVCRLKQGAKIKRARIKRLARGVEVVAPLSVTLKQAQGYLEKARKE